MKGPAANTRAVAGRATSAATLQMLLLLQREGNRAGRLRVCAAVF